LTFFDIPWPVIGNIKGPASLDAPTIKAFLMSQSHSPAKAIKQRVRDAMLRFHPDRFEGRWLDHIRESDRPFVKDGVGRVVRFLTEASAQLS
jgi:hypothetical protein